MKFTLLGLGDSNYWNFNVHAHQIEERLRDLGAATFYQIGYADDGAGLEIIADPWIEGLWGALESLLSNSLHHDLVVANGYVDNCVDDSDSAELADLVSHISLTNDGLSSDLRMCSPDLSHLSNSELGVPALPHTFLKVDFASNVAAHECRCFHGIAFPSQQGCIFKGKVNSIKRLTQSSSHKDTFEVWIGFESDDVAYKPGDSFSLIPVIPTGEVEALLTRLGVSEIEQDAEFNISILPETTKRLPKVPNFFCTHDSLRDLFKHCLDIRHVPKKAFFRMLAEHATDVGEKRRLLELCSRKGSEFYHELIRNDSLCLLDILNQFPSCKPPLNRVLEHLPRLLPRAYSAANYQDASPHQLRFVFNLVDVKCDRGRTFHRKGLCTGQLSSLPEGSDIFLFYRSIQNFRMPSDPSKPIIMIGPGTGIAPFIGFIEQRQSASLRPTAWLFYGCRNFDLDFLFKEELFESVESGILDKLFIALSRDESMPASSKNVSFRLGYVQDCLRSQGDQLVRLIHEEGAYVFLCGDAKNMSKDVTQCLLDLLCMYLDLDVTEGRLYLDGLRKAKRLLEDVWT